MSRTASPFRPAAVLGLLLVGAGAFLLLLFALGKGWTGDNEQTGGAHAASNGLIGYAGLVRLLEAGGRKVELSRNPADAEDYSLLVLTPPPFADPEQIESVLEQRQFIGPTVLILPKWQAMPLDPASAEQAGAGEGWVRLAGAGSPAWFSQLALAQGSELVIGRTYGWEAYGQNGQLARADTEQALIRQPDSALDPLVLDTERDMLAGLSWYHSDSYPVLIVFDPDLANNMGLADEARASIALQLIDEASDYDAAMPVVFDLTLAGMGASRNLLTLAFEPPFLAATLCLLLAALVIAWRAFRRFGPPVAELPELAHGKAGLARNGAALVGRVRRWHLLAEPYAALVAARLATTLGLRETATDAREAAIARVLERRGHGQLNYPAAAHAMRHARGAGEILRAARALRTIERIVGK